MDYMIEAELILTTAAILNPNSFVPEKSAVIKLKMSAENIVDTKALGGDAKDDLERQVGREVIKALAKGEW